MIYSACGLLLKQYDSTNEIHALQKHRCALSIEHTEFWTTITKPAPDSLPLISTHCLTKNLINWLKKTRFTLYPFLFPGQRACGLTRPRSDYFWHHSDLRFMFQSPKQTPFSTSIEITKQNSIVRLIYANKTAAHRMFLGEWTKLEFRQGDLDDTRGCLIDMFKPCLNTY